MTTAYNATGSPEADVIAGFGGIVSTIVAGFGAMVPLFVALLVVGTIASALGILGGWRQSSSRIVARDVADGAKATGGWLWRTMRHPQWVAVACIFAAAIFGIAVWTGILD